MAGKFAKIVHGDHHIKYRSASGTRFYFDYVGDQWESPHSELGSALRRALQATEGFAHFHFRDGELEVVRKAEVAHQAFRRKLAANIQREVEQLQATAV